MHRETLMNNTIMRAVLENYTPLMMGDFLGHSYEKTNPGSDVVLVQNPAKSVIGKSRWLLRVLVATAGCATSHRQAERKPPIEVVLGGNTERKLTLGLVQLLFGGLKPAWSGLYSLHTRLEITSQNPVDEVYKKQWSVTTRYKLATMGQRREEAELKAPLKPGSVRLEVVLARRPGVNAYRFKHAGGNGQPGSVGLDTLDSLASGLVLTTLRVLGIGSGANRGFGRFRILEYDGSGGSRAREIVNLLKKLDQASQDEARHALRKVFENMIGMVREAGCSSSASGSAIKMPSIDLESIRVYRLGYQTINCLNNIYQRLPGSRGKSLNSLRGVHRVLEIIGLVTLKSSWKTCNMEHRSGGGGYNTWILGLPRRQSQHVGKPCFTGNRRRHQQSHGSDGRAEPLPTGYLVRVGGRGYGEVVPESWGSFRLAEVDKQYVEKNGSVYTLPQSRHTSGNDILVAEGRRQSPFILFPTGPATDSNNLIIALVPLYPGDMEQLVAALLHSGGLVKTDDEGKPLFVDAVRLAPITDIMGGQVERTEVKCPEEEKERFVNNGITCPARPGVKTHKSHGCDKPHTNSILDYAYSSALEFFDALLGRCGSVCRTPPPKKGGARRGRGGFRRRW